MAAHRVALSALLFAVTMSPLACGGEREDADVLASHGESDGDGDVGKVTSTLLPNDTVAAAIASEACATSVVRGLSVQLVEEIQCLRPATFTKIDKLLGFSLGSSVVPYMQTAAAQALARAQKTRGVPMVINSALRTLPQQFLLYGWYQTGRCGIGLAASPGTSNHEGAIAVDVNDTSAWRAAMQNSGFRWLGDNDAVHYDFVGGGNVDLRGLSVRAFQRLWNRNRPNDPIEEDGTYGPSTATRLEQSPIGGFAKGAICNTSTETGPTGGPPPAKPTPSATPSSTVPGGPVPSDLSEPKNEAQVTQPPPGRGVAIESASASSQATGCALAFSGAPTRERSPSDAPHALGLSLAAALALKGRRRRA